MRSRYSAYVLKLVDYLVATTHPDARVPRLREQIQHTADRIRWTGLTILSTRQGQATDKTGYTQTAERTALAPDGASGHHTIKIKVK